MESARMFQRIFMESRNFRQRNYSSESESNSNEMINKEELKEEEINNKKNEISINPWIINKFILDFLLINGMKEGALEFTKEAGIENYNLEDLNNQKIILMSNIRKSIWINNIETTIDLLNQFNPEFLLNNKEIYFELLSIKLLELIETKNLNKIINFIKIEMFSNFKDSENYINKIEILMGEIFMNRDNVKNIKLKLKNKEELILLINNSLHQYFNDFNYSNIEILILLKEFFEKKMEGYYNFDSLKY